MSKLKSHPIAEGAHSHVYDNGNGTVTKVPKEEGYHELLPGIHTRKMKYAANVLSTVVYPNIEGLQSIVKEKLSLPDSSFYFLLEDLLKEWDDSLLHAYEMFDFIEARLIDYKKPFTELPVVGKFNDYLLSKSDKGKAVRLSYLWIQLIQIVQELQNLGIYNLDWNPENFGYKEGRLALFELGGAKLKNKNK